MPTESGERASDRGAEGMRVPSNPSACLLALLATAFFLAPTALSRQSAAGERIRVGVYPNRPLVFLDEQGEARGVFPETMEEIAGRERWSVEYVPCSWNECLDRLDSGELDLMMDVAYSEERSRRWDFNEEAVLLNWVQVYVHEETEVSSLLDLDGRRVSILDESIQEIDLRNLLDSFHVNSEIVEASDNSEVLRLVSGEEVFAGVVNRTYGHSHEHEFEVRRTPIMFSPAEARFAAARGRGAHLLNAIDRHLLAMKRDPGSVYNSSLERWFGWKVKAESSYWIWWVSCAAALLLLALAVLALVQRRRARARARQLSEKESSLMSEIVGHESTRRILHKSEKARRLSEHRFQVALKNAPLSVFTQDRELRYTWIHNAPPAFEKADSINKTEKDLLRAEDARRLVEIKRDVLESGRGAREIVRTTIEGCEHWYDLTVEPIRGADGSIDGIICASWNVTSQKNLESQLRRSQKMEAVGRLAGGVAHDFNNLLTAIIGYAEIAARDLKEQGRAVEEVEGIVEAARRATSLTRQLLAFSRKQVLRPRVVDVNSIVASAEKLLRRLIGEDVRLVLELARERVEVEVDETQLEQVLMNLVINAKDAMPTGGELTIGTSKVSVDSETQIDGVVLEAGSYALLEVSDTGTGMDEETRQKVFDPFFTTKGADRGTGLGLSTVFGIVEQSRGFVFVRSSPGDGAWFGIYLPLTSKSEKRDACESSIGISKEIGGRETILLVEDEQMVRKPTRMILEHFGYRVLEASSGEEALSIVESARESIDLLLTDIVMPGISGVELVERLRSRKTAIPVLFMSGYSDDVIAHHGNRTASINLIEKPFSLVDLARRVRETIDQQGNR
ncbi:MAG: response regulator [Polyangia bacterium]